MHFPKFEGENPKLWQSRCENYFDMYYVDPHIWVRVATMHFDGPAACWLQSVNHRIRTTTWTELCSWIHDRFGRDQHEALIRQLFHIKQVGSVQDYVDKFTELIDQLLAYEPAANQRYYTTRFVDGLKDDIKSVILVQRPVDLDIACLLTLLQEEARVDRRHDYRWSDILMKPKPYSGPAPLSLPPPPKLGTSLGGVATKDHRAVVATCASQVDDKVAAS
jgi:hypothetical protein